VGLSAPHSGLRPPHGDVEQRIRGHGLAGNGVAPPGVEHKLSRAEASVAGSPAPPSRVELPCADVEQQSWLELGLTGAASRG
jgi:hypothetical protein